jgi:uncharacterized protein (DUF2132 family)
MEKQTAVEWLVEQRLQGVNLDDALEQAKEMYKEEMIHFAIKCMFNSDDISSNLKNYFIQKYNETYGGNNEK